MKIGINMDFYKGLTDDEQISLMKQNGFTSTFFFSNTEALDERVSKLRRAGMEIDFLHAPYRGITRPAFPTLDFRAWIVLWSMRVVLA